MSRIPDYSEYIVGWRLWVVYANRLHSVVMLDEWHPKEVFAVPELLSYLMKAGRLDGSTSSVGIYALKDPWQLMWLPDRSLAVGRVALWGWVYEHERGYRAQYAYPLSIRRFSGPRFDMEQLCGTYGIQYERRKVLTWGQQTARRIIFAMFLGVVATHLLFWVLR